MSNSDSSGSGKTPWIVGTCGACIAFLPEGSDPEGPRGRCHFRPEIGQISHLLPRCPKYVERGTGATYKPPPVARPRGVTRATLQAVFDNGRDDERAGPPPPRYGKTIDLGEAGDDTMDTAALRALIQDVLREEGTTGYTPLGKKWEGGTIVLKPGEGDLQVKELPIEAFFHKIVMLRDKLRVLEQKINTHDKLTEAEKIDLQQYITRVYGTLTTFNVLFRDKNDQFVGSKTD